MREGMLTQMAQLEPDGQRRQSLKRELREIVVLLDQIDRRQEEHLELALEEQFTRLTKWWMSHFEPEKESPYTNGPYSISLVWATDS
jgi:hypothetical protein